MLGVWSVSDLHHLHEQKDNIVPWVCAVIAGNLVMYHSLVVEQHQTWYFVRGLYQSSGKHVVIPWACPGIAAGMVLCHRHLLDQQQTHYCYSGWYWSSSKHNTVPQACTGIAANMLLCLWLVLEQHCMSHLKFLVLTFAHQGCSCFPTLSDVSI